MGDPVKITWGSSRVFPFLAPRGHWRPPVLGTGGWFPPPPPNCRPSLWLGPILVAHRRGVVPTLLRFAFFEEVKFSLQILQYCSHLSHGVWLLPCVPLLWGDLLFCQRYLASLSGGHFIFSHGLRSHGWHISAFAVPWSWRHACEGIVYSLSFPNPQRSHQNVKVPFFLSTQARGSWAK